MNKLLISLSLAIAFLLSSFSLAAQTETADTLPDNVPALKAKASSAYAARDYLTYRKSLQRLNKMRPNNSGYMYQLVLAHALLDEKPEAYSIMLSMQQQGLAYDFSLNDDVNNIRGTEVFDYVNDMMIMAGDPVGEIEAAFTLPESILSPEAIAWDESRQRFLVGSLNEGTVHAVDMDGQATELFRASSDNGMWAIYGLLVDQQRNRLWVSSAATSAFSGFSIADKGRSSLFEFDLTTLELVGRYPVPVDGRPHVLGSMVLSPTGDIYIADRALPIIYSKPAGEQKLTGIFASREMISLRGLAIQPDGSLLYVADREMGIMVIDLKGKKAGKVTFPETLNIGGIDGLYLWNNHLIMIQNGIKPQRVMRLALDETGTKITAVRPLAVAMPEFDLPDFGTLKEQDLYFFANSQSSSADGPKKAVEVVRTSVESNADLVQPDMMKYLEERSEKQKAALNKGG